MALVERREVIVSQSILFHFESKNKWINNFIKECFYLNFYIKNVVILTLAASYEMFVIMTTIPFQWANYDRIHTFIAAYEYGMI